MYLAHLLHRKGKVIFIHTYAGWYEKSVEPLLLSQQILVRVF